MCDCQDYCEWCTPSMCGLIETPEVPVAEPAPAPAPAPAEPEPATFEFRTGQAVETPAGPATVLQNAMRHESIHAMSHELVPHVKVAFVDGGVEWFATYDVYDLHDARFDGDLQNGNGGTR